MMKSPGKHDSATQKSKPSAQEKKHTEELLDEALDETFPASDPPAMLEPVHHLKRKKDEK